MVAKRAFAIAKIHPDRLDELNNTNIANAVVDSLSLSRRAARLLGDDARQLRLLMDDAPQTCMSDTELQSFDKRELIAALRAA